MRKTLILQLTCLALAPLTMAPQCHTVFPNFPTTGTAFPSFKAAQQSVEPKLVEADADSVVAMGFSNWDTVEPCNACAGTNCSTTSYPVGFPLDTQTQHTRTSASGTSYRCNYNFQNLDDYMKVHVDANGARTTRRHIMIQLAPTFYTDFTAPKYLLGLAFDSDAFKTAFRQLWDQARPVIQLHRGSGADPLVLIGLGNEVNAYIRAAGGAAALWTQYTNFVADASAYIDATMAYTYETVSIEFHSFQNSEDCGPGDVLVGWVNCRAASQKALALTQSTDVMTYTYYPPRNLTTTQLQARIRADFQAMSGWAAGPQKSVLIQEAGYPTSGGSSTQRAFVDAFFAEWANFSRIGGASYHSLTDFPSHVFMPTGFFTSSGAVKSDADWSNFKAKMAALP